MKLFKSQIALCTALAGTLIATESNAGGLFGEGGLQGGQLKMVIEQANISEPMIANPDPTATSKFNQIADPLAPSMTPSAKGYFILQQEKTDDQRAYEDQAGKALGVPVSNICFTASQACTVSYTTTGSSCFCNTSTGVDIGIVK